MKEKKRNPFGVMTKLKLTGKVSLSLKMLLSNFLDLELISHVIWHMYLVITEMVFLNFLEGFNRELIH